MSTFTVTDIIDGDYVSPQWKWKDETGIIRPQDNRRANTAGGQAAKDKLSRLSKGKRSICERHTR